MNMGYRFFVVGDDNSIIPISQRTFNDFYLKHRQSLPRFSGTVINVATVVYTTENRRPKQIVRIECMRVKVDSAGALDRDQIETGSRLLANRIDKIFGEVPPDSRSGSVVNAVEKFDERRWSQLHPPLSGPAHKQILEILFGTKHAV